MKKNNATHHHGGRWLVAAAVALTTAVSAHADYTSTVLADTPVAYYPLNSIVDSGTNATDLSGNHDDGTYVNTAPGANDAAGPSAFIPKAIAFDGSTTMVDLSTGPNTGVLDIAGPITMEAWVQPADTSFGDIIGKGYDSASYDEITLRVNGPYGANFYATVGNAQGNSGVTGGKQSLNWKHVVVTSDGTSTTMYVDGLVVQSNPDTVGANVFGDPWAIGNGTSAGNSRHFKGNICQVAIYSYALSPAQVQTHYNVGMYGVATVTQGKSLKWSGTANSGTWDAGTSANWINTANSQTVDFTNADAVLFNDVAGAPTSVNVSGNVLPDGMVVNSSTNSYTFGGAGSIAGSGSLTKLGTSSLTWNVESYLTGSVVVGGGTLVTDNGVLQGASSITVTNGGTIDFNGNQITGKAVSLAGTGSGGTGSGALVNNGGDFYNSTLNITLLGDTSLGGTHRWDLDVGSSITGAHKVIINRAPGVYGEWKSVAIDPSVTGIELASGTLGIKDMGAGPATPIQVDSGAELDFWSGEGYTNSIDVESNAAVKILYGFNNFDANFTFENGANFQSFWGSGTQNLNGTMTLNGVVHIVLGDANYIFSNVISGPGGFVWDAYNHQMILEATNTYTGPTIIDGGLTVVLSGNASISDSSLIFFGGNNTSAIDLDASGRVDGTLTLASGQTLGGIGGVGGNLVVSQGATVAPAGTNMMIGITSGGYVTGAISVFGDATLNGTTVIKLNGNGTNDSIATTGNLTYGGTLNLVNVSGAPMAAGNSFTVFSAASYSGSFDHVVPTTPGSGLAWDLSQLNSGVIGVVTGSGGGSNPVAGAPHVSGSNLVFNGTGGTPNATYYVVASTNLMAPLANWQPVLTNTYDASGNFNVTTPLSTGAAHMYYRIKQ